MPLYREKPVVIEARQLTDDADWEDIAKWCGGELVNHRDPSDEYTTTLIIRTPEGDMRAGEDDWVIKGVKGEFYPCKPDIVAATYEEVDRELQPL